MPTLPAKIRAARAGVGIGQQALADEAGIHLSTIRQIEGDGQVEFESLLRCQFALQARNVEFIEFGGRHGLVFEGNSAGAGGAALRAGRSALRMGRSETADMARIGEATVARIETAANVTQSTIRSTSWRCPFLGGRDQR